MLLCIIANTLSALAFLILGYLAGTQHLHTRIGTKKPESPTKIIDQFKQPQHKPKAGSLLAFRPDRDKEQERIDKEIEAHWRATGIAQILEQPLEEKRV